MNESMTGRDLAFICSMFDYHAEKASFSLLDMVKEQTEVDWNGGCPRELVEYWGFRYDELQERFYYQVMKLIDEMYANTTISSSAEALKEDFDNFGYENIEEGYEDIEVD